MSFSRHLPKQRKGRQRGPFVIGALLLLHSPLSPAAARPFLQLDSLTWSGPVSLHAALNKWQTNDFHSSERQFTTQWLEAGLRHDNGWGISLLYRYDYSLRFTSDTALYYHRSQNGADIADGQYNLGLAVSHFEATGLRIEKRLHHAGTGATLNLGVSYLRTGDLLDGEIRGDTRRATIDYHYAEDKLFGRKVAAPEGRLLSLDAAFSWQPSERLHLEGRIRDLNGLIIWRQAPRAIATADAQRSNTDAAGITSLEPLVSGQELTETRWRQTLAPRLFLSTQYDVGKRTSLALLTRHLDNATYWAGGIAWASRGGITEIDYWPALRMTTVTYATQRWKFRLGADSLDDRRFRSLSLGISLQY